MKQDNKGLPVVIDNGQYQIKVGYSGGDAPIQQFPSIVGRSRRLHGQMHTDDKIYVGYQALSPLLPLLKLNYPIELGIIKDWDGMTSIWHQSLYGRKQKIIPSEHPVLLTEAPHNPKINRQKTTEIMFENLQVPQFYLANKALLPLYASGRTNGLVVDSGEGAAYAVPVFEGYALPHATKRNELAGRSLTECMRKMLNRGNSNDYMEITRKIKENLCYVAMDYEAEVAAKNNFNQDNFVNQLPDGYIIRQKTYVGSQRFKVPEALFEPELITGRSDVLSIQEMIYRSILDCDVELRKDFYNNIVMSGGSTLFPGMGERLTKELTGLAPSTMKIKVVAPAERKFLTWIGGSIFSWAIRHRRQLWISKAEYDETGASIVHRKCF